MRGKVFAGKYFDDPANTKGIAKSCICMGYWLTWKAQCWALGPESPETRDVGLDFGSVHCKRRFPHDGEAVSVTR